MGALDSQIALSCDLTTVQGQRMAIDALNDASHWFLILMREAEKVSATTDLSISCPQMLREILSAQIADLQCNFPGSTYNSFSAAPPVAMLYQKALFLSTFGPLAENLAKSSIPRYLLSKLKSKTSHFKFPCIDITQNFLRGYCEAESLLREGCLPPCLDLLSEAGPVMIMDGNLAANL
ncbi:hypothetical protein Ahy_B02g057666 [Arachis hypogaea]|uniref:Uncharacterized protein n=1 Tax=Arachis hypogaea TaxID=3818 RepID=A0A445ACT8_ARAHY|nr:hypothetical protein Ahy_B02g057666 [Arachis hypogaea]